MLVLAARRDKRTTEEKERRNKERAHIIQPQLFSERHRTGVGVVEEGRLGLRASALKDEKATASSLPQPSAS